MTTGIEPARTARRTELDAIRALVVVGLVFFHSALVFDTRDDFYVKNPETTSVTTVFVGLAVVWAMPMLFAVAGLASWHSTRRRGSGGFVRERLLRLGLPLVFATVTIIPVPPWLRLKADPSYHESYLRFLPRFFDVRLDLSDFPFVLRGQYFEFGHLWFVVMLLVWSIVLAALVRWLPGGHRAREWLAAGVRHRGAVLLAALPVAAITAVLGMEEPYAGWSRWAYLLFFLYGFVLASDDRFRAAMRRDAVPAAVAAVLLSLGGLIGLLIAGGDPFTDLTPFAIVARALYGAAGWCCLVAIMGLLDRRRSAARAPAPETPPAALPVDLSAAPPADPPVVPALVPALVQSVPAPGLRRRAYLYLAEAVLPLYILHQPIVVAVAYFVVGWHAPIAVKYVVLVVVSLALVLAVYDLVRRAGVTRFLFGMRS